MLDLCFDECFILSGLLLLFILLIIDMRLKYCGLNYELS